MLLHNIAQKTARKTSLDANNTEWFSDVGWIKNLKESLFNVQNRFDHMKLRTLLSSFGLIHFLVALGLLSTLGWTLTNTSLLIFFSALSFAGAICGAFIRVIDKSCKK